MLSAIVAVAQNNAIGKNGKMPWHIREDLQYFKKTTMHKTLIMGRKTFESLPALLEGRSHIVVTNKTLPNTPDVTYTNDLVNTLQTHQATQDETFIIGGATIYKAALPYCNKLYITHILHEFEGDTFFDEIPSQFTLTTKTEIKIDRKSQIPFYFATYTT